MFRYCGRAVAESQRLLSTCRTIVSKALRSGRGGIGISVEKWPQRPLERLQVRLVCAPLLRRITVDRLAHLFRAWCANRTLGLVELEDLRLEFEPTMFK